jgi:hypothetical protein
MTRGATSAIVRTITTGPHISPIVSIRVIPCGGQTASTIGGTTDRIAPFHGGSVTIKIANVGGGQAATGVVDFERRIDRAS